jgi:hypothetical protein
MKKGRVVLVLLLSLSFGTLLRAQDTKYRPQGQQIPTPECLVMRGAWEGGSTACTQSEHEAWLADISHWRVERRIRIGYNGSRYGLPAPLSQLALAKEPHYALAA